MVSWESARVMGKVTGLTRHGVHVWAEVPK